MRVIGLMSGTSVDAIDAAAVDFAREGDALRARLVGFASTPWADDERGRLLAVLPPATTTVAEVCELDALVGRRLGEAAAALARDTGGCELVCSHGQTLHHWVGPDGRARGTLQVGNPAWIHAATGLPVVADLRSADIAAGGQGAPLAPVLDRLWLAGTQTAALNLGGIANVTLPDGTAGDTGPANCLLDAEAARIAGLPFDVDGRLAAAGAVDERALAALLADPYFALPLPKSTGRDHFNPAWLRARLGGELPPDADLMATLVELTARTVAAHARGAATLAVSGGGARNPVLLARLAALTRARVVDSAELGLPGQAKEAVLFALLGYLAVHGVPATTVVLGTLTPPAPVAAAGDPVRRLLLG